MRKVLFVSVISILICSCKKEITSHLVNGGNEYNAQSATTSSTYLPLTKDTYWKYHVKTDDETPDMSKLTVLGITKKINNKNYQSINSVKDGETDTLYYAHNNHDYYIYTNSGTSSTDKISMEILFLKDNVSVGSSWVLSAGTANGVNLRCYGKIIEKNFTMTFSGTTYKNVIHSYVEIRKPLLFTYIVVNRQDFYTAEGIGIIKNTSDVSLPVNSTTLTNITNYDINP